MGTGCMLSSQPTGGVRICGVTLPRTSTQDQDSCKMMGQDSVKHELQLHGNPTEACRLERPGAKLEYACPESGTQ